jgi:hypothetical protein
LKLQLNQAMSVDLTMQLGPVNETVEVPATATQLNCVSPGIGHVAGGLMMLTSL